MIISWAIDEIFKRGFVYFIVFLLVYFISSRLKEKQVIARVPWNMKDTALLLFCFLVFMYTLNSVAFYGDVIFSLGKNNFMYGNLAGLIYEILVIFSILLFVRYKYKFTVGLERSRIRNGLLWGIGILVVLEFFTIASKIFGMPSVLRTKGSLSLLMIISTVITGPISEELLFRGFVYPAIRQKVGIGIAIFLSSVLFTVYHQLLDSWSGVFIFSVIFCIAYEKSGSLLAPIIGHIAKNIFNVILSYDFGFKLNNIYWVTLVVIFIVTFVVFIILFDKNNRENMLNGSTYR